MLHLILHPLKRPAEKQVDLLVATLDMHGIDYVKCSIDKVPEGATIITDCFIMETPCGDPGDDIARNIIERAASHNNKIVFYYPSESYATLSASFCPTAEAIQEKNIKAKKSEKKEKKKDIPYKKYADNNHLREGSAVEAVERLAPTR